MVAGYWVGGTHAGTSLQSRAVYGMKSHPLHRHLSVTLALLALGSASSCQEATAVRLHLYSDVAWGQGRDVAIASGIEQADATDPVATIGTAWSSPDLGDLVLVPKQDGEVNAVSSLVVLGVARPATKCTVQAPAGCIFARRRVSFVRHRTLTLPIVLHAACIGVPCDSTTTCNALGRCVPAQIDAGCDSSEGCLLPGDTVPGAFTTPQEAGLDAGGDASASSGLLQLAVSAGTLSPAFAPTTRSYGVASSVASLGLPFRVTPTYTSDATVTVNGAPVPSGTASQAIALNLQTPTPIDVTVTTGAAAPARYAIVVPPVQEAYVKSSNTGSFHHFGFSVALSGDTLAVGAPNENSGGALSGAAYVFTRTGSAWTQQAYVKASNTRATAHFAYSVALSGDTLAVGSTGESSGTTGVDGNQNDTSAPDSGAVYLFTRTGTAWNQQAYVKAPNTRAGALFGSSLVLSGDTLAVGSPKESSAATGIDGNDADTTAPAAGAVYVYNRTGNAWSKQAYIKASNARAGAAFGSSVALSADTLAVGSPKESSGALGINGNGADSSALEAGAAYVYARTGSTWSQQAYVKASNTNIGYAFGASVALAGDTLAVGSPREAGGATGVNGSQVYNPLAGSSGAAYVYARNGTVWKQQAYVKASNKGGSFGGSVALFGNVLAVAAPSERSNAAGINGNQTDTSAGPVGAGEGAGAAYLFMRTGTAWTQNAYVKASNLTGYFGNSMALTADTLAVGSWPERSGATGINGDQADTSTNEAGAVYIFR